MQLFLNRYQCSSLDNDVTQTLCSLHDKLRNIVASNTNDNNQIGHPQAIKSCVLLKLLLVVRCNAELITSTNIKQNENSFLLYCSFDDHHSYEYIETVLNVMILVLADNGELYDEEDDYEFTSSELDFLQILSNEHSQAISTYIQNSNEIKLTLDKLVNDVRFYPMHTIKAYIILSKLSPAYKTVDELETLLSLTNNKPDDFKNAILNLITASMKNTKIQLNPQFINNLLHTLRTVIQSYSLDKLR